MIDIQQHLTRQMIFSKATFGPGERMAGVIDHILKELAEVRMADNWEDRVAEWCDVAILALDGLTREVWAGLGYQISADEAADIAWRTLLAKQQKNERREWPDWRTAPADKAIEHVRGAME